MRPVLLLLLISTFPAFAQTTSLQPGDQVQVRPLNPQHSFSPLLTLKLTVTPEGRLVHPDLGINCDVLGLEPTDAKALLNAELPLENDRPQLSILSTRDNALLANQDAIAIGGQVRTPGPIEFKTGMTLAQVVAAAGGTTEFGAKNRVRLYRNGKVYTYDLRKPEHAKITLTRYDIIDIPMKNWVGH